ncbi:MAG: hypothetical protein K2Q20_02105, partial [Phycisphaerales bacterium]|nr:hypothetical protein [Phycisphaerales bacterium]
MRTFVFAAFVGAIGAGAGGVLAQSGSGVSITDNNITWTQADWQTSNTAAISATAWNPSPQPNALRVSDLPLGVNTFSNYAHQNDWFYRFSTSGNAEFRERNFANASNRTVNGNSVSWDFTLNNTGSGGGSLQATLTQRVIGIGGGQGRVEQTLTLTNNTAQDQSIALFNWAKIQAGLTTATSNALSVASSGAGQRTISFTNANSFDPPVSVTFSGTGLTTTANNYQAETFSTTSGLLVGLTNSTITSLTNAGTSGNTASPQGALRFDVSVAA